MKHLIPVLLIGLLSGCATPKPLKTENYPAVAGTSIPERILELLGQGKTYAEIGKEVGLTAYHVGTIARQLGRPRPRGGRTGRRRIGAEKIDRIIDLIAEGKSYRAIAKEVDIREETVSRIARELGEDRKRPGPARNPELRENIAQMLREGKTIRQIAQELGTSPTTINSVVREFGLSRRSPSRRMTPEKRQSALELLRQGDLTYRKIAERLNVDVGAVGDLARASGLARPMGRTGSRRPPDGNDQKSLYGVPHRRVIVADLKQLGPRIGDAGKPLIDGDGDGKCREHGNKFVPCPPGVPAGTLLGRLTEAVDPLEGIDLELFRITEEDTEDDLAYNLMRQAKYEDWQQWAECRAMRRHAFDIVAGEPGPADPHIDRSQPNFFGDPRIASGIDEVKMHAQARYLLGELARAAQAEEQEDRPLYRAVRLPSDPRDFESTFREGRIVDLPLLATSAVRREGPNEFLTRYGSDVLLEIRGPTVGLTGGPITILATEDDEQLMIGQIDYLAERLEWDVDAGEVSEGVEEVKELVKKIRALLEEYEDTRKAGQRDRLNKAREALREIAEDFGLTREYAFAGDELDETMSLDYWDRVDDIGEDGQREVITGGRFRVVTVEPDPDGVYETRIILEHVGTFDPRVRGGIIPVRRSKT